MAYMFTPLPIEEKIDHFNVNEWIGIQRFEDTNCVISVATSTSGFFEAGKAL